VWLSGGRRRGGPPSPSPYRLLAVAQSAPATGSVANSLQTNILGPQKNSQPESLAPLSIAEPTAPKPPPNHTPTERAIPRRTPVNWHLHSGHASASDRKRPICANFTSATHRPDAAHATRLPAHLPCGHRDSHKTRSPHHKCPQPATEYHSPLDIPSPTHGCLNLSTNTHSLGRTTSGIPRTPAQHPDPVPNPHRFLSSRPETRSPCPPSGQGHYPET
jgi:hypothetical protein